MSFLSQNSKQYVKTFGYLVVLPICAIIFLYFLFSYTASIVTVHGPSNPIVKPIATTTVDTTVASKTVSLNVPYISEAPDNIWTGSWKNACEEASIAMVDRFYAGSTTVSIAAAKSFLQKLFDVEDKVYGSNANSDTVRSNYLIDNHTNFKGTIVTNPTIDQIKAEIRAGHPVIAFHHGFDLHNANIPFLATGSSYHSTVVAGFDDAKGVFLVNDPGDEIDSKNHLYTYETYMSSLHDYDFKTGKADGPPRVIFTSK
jgi:uncharacterized protein YvpB